MLSCFWQGLLDKFTTRLCLQLISSCSKPLPTLAWMWWFDCCVAVLTQQEGNERGKLLHFPCSGQKTNGKLDDFLLFQESVGHTVHFQWGGSVIPNPLLLSLRGTKLRENHKTKMLPCSLNSCRLEGNKGRATFFTVKMPNPSDNSLMWKSHSSTKTVQFCGLRGAGELQKRWEILQVVSYSL